MRYTAVNNAGGKVAGSTVMSGTAWVLNDRNFMLYGCRDFENTNISSCKMRVYQSETGYRSSNSYIFRVYNNYCRA